MEKQTELNTELRKAIESSDYCAVEECLKKGADVNARDSFGSTPLHYAAFRGRKAIAELLISNGANVDVKDSYGSSPLRDAVFAGHVDVAELLITNGADVNAKDEKSWTPLHYAVDKWHSQLIDILIARGADVNARNSDNETPLQHTLKKSNTLLPHIKEWISEKLITNGAEIEDSAICLAVEQSLVEVLKLLAQEGVSLNAKKPGGASLLHIAASASALPSLEFLLANGADVDVMDSNNMTALDISVQKGYRNIADILMAHGSTLRETTASKLDVFPPAADGYTCDSCKKNFKGQHDWGFSCPTCRVRFCLACLAKRTWRTVPADFSILRNAKNLIDKICPRCDGNLVDDIF